MKINLLEITNFMGLTAKLDTTEPVNVFFGLNGAGKSALLDAIYWAFIGTCPHRGIKNLNQGQELGTNGAGDVIVDCFTSEGQIHRDFKKGKDSKFGPSLVFDPADMAIILDPARVLKMDAKSRQAVLGRLFRSEATANKTTECLQKHAISQEARKKILENLDTAQKWAVLRRQEAKRSEKDLTAALPEIPPLIVEIGGKKVDLTEHALTDVEKILIARRLERDARQAEITHTAATENVEQVKIVLARNTLDIEDLKRERSELEAKHPDLPQRRELVENKYQDLWKAAQDLDSDWKAAKKAHEAAKAISGKCPTCQKVMSATALKDLLKKLKHTEEVAKGNAATANSEYEKVAADLQALNQQRADAQRELEHYTNEIQQYQDKIDEQEKQIARAETSAPRLEALQAELEDFDQRVANLTALVEAKRVFKTAVETIANLNQRVESVQADIAAMDKVDQLLKPDGELRQIANEGLSNLEFDKPLAAAWGMESLEIKTDGTILLYNRPIEMASVTERWRASVLIAELLSRASEIGILVLDGMDILTDTRGALQDRLDDWQRRYDTILLNVAVKEPPDIDAPDGWKYFWVGDGTVKPLAALEEVA